MSPRTLDIFRDKIAQIEHIWKHNSGKVIMDAIVASAILSNDRYFKKMFITEGMRVTVGESMVPYLLSLSSHLDENKNIKGSVTSTSVIPSLTIELQNVTHIEIELIQSEEDLPPIRIIRFLDKLEHVFEAQFEESEFRDIEPALL